MPAFYEYAVKVRVPNYLVAQGEVLDAERLQRMVDDEFPGYEGDVKVMITQAPDKAAILREQA